MPVFQVEFDISKLRSGASDAIKVLGNTSKAANETSSSMAALSKGSNAAVVNIKKLAAEIVALIGVYKTLDTAMSYVRRGMSRLKQPLLQSLQRLTRSLRPKVKTLKA